MGVGMQGPFSQADRTYSFPNDSPLGVLFSSLNSAKEIIIPVVSFSSFGRTQAEDNRSVSMLDSFLAAINVREESAVGCQSNKEQPQQSLHRDIPKRQFVSCHFQGPLDGGATLHKENQPCQTFCGCGDFRKDDGSSVQHNQLLAAFLEGLPNSCLNQLLKQGNGFIHSVNECCSRNKDLKDFLSPVGLQKHFSGLSMQGLSGIVSSCGLVSKTDCMPVRDPQPISFVNTDDAYEIGKPTAASFFQIIIEHCVLVSANLSKQAGQLVPWNDNSMCNIDDLKQKMLCSCNENFCINVTVHDSQVSSSCHKQDLDKKSKQIKSFRPVDLGFARVGGEQNAGNPSPNNVDRSGNHSETSESHEQEESSKTAAGVFRVPVPNIEWLRSTWSTVSLTEFMELVPQIRKTSQDFPDKKKLFSVQDFFRYTEAAGRRFFEELDRDNDGQVTLEDLEAAMRKRRLPMQYAREFLRRTRKHWFAKSFGWSEFLSLMEQKEPMMLRAYNSLSLSKSGTLQKGQVLLSLRNAGLPATDENAAAMMRCLDADTEGSISYGQFRNFMLLLPPERLGDDPRMVWYEAATVVPMAPPVAVPAESVLKSALAGGLACALSTSLMHPMDTMKTRVQASSTISFPELISKLPEIGVRGLYRGSLPAIWGQFLSHGLRTGIFEASKLLLTNLAPDVAELQVQSLSSFCSTVLGTAVRIPCEVLKQRLQAGIFDNVGDAIVGTWQKDGPRGFFRGTGATLCREVPFYVAGMVIYEEAKKVMHRVLNRELAPWETIVVGAMSGGLAAVFTTPFDVMKTRTMTAAPGLSTRMRTIAVTIVREEGLLGLFKGAVPRFFWIAPLGAMNFAGYELAKRAMVKNEDEMEDSPRKSTNT